MEATSLKNATREVLWNVSSLENQVIMYVLFALSCLVFAVGVWRRIELWRQGTSENRLTKLPQRALAFLTDAVGQRKVNRDRAAEVFHTLIFWGFLALFFATTVVFIDHDLGIKIYHGEFYLLVTVLSDVLGFGALIGVGIAYHRRFIQKVPRIHNTRADGLMLLLFALMILQGFGLEALRIAATNDPWAPYSPVGLAFSLPLWPLSDTALRSLHFALWWFHTITVFVFIALLPYTKFFHIISSSLNLFFQDFEKPKGTLKSTGDIEKLMEEAASGGDFQIGVSNIMDLSWKQRLDLDACTACGRCQEVCPAYNSGKVLSPKWLILDSRDHMLSLRAKEEGRNPLAKLDSFLLQNIQLGQTKEDSPQHRGENELVQHAAQNIGGSQEDSLAGDVLEEDVFWSCTTCRACVEVCPVGIEHVDYIVDVRRSLALMEGKIPKEAAGSLRAIETRGNPFGPAEERAAWCDGLDVPALSPGDEVDVLYWVGCVSAYDKRKQDIARAMVRILKNSGLRWGMLGSKENCTGDPARRLGEENLFQTQAKKNIELLSSISFDTLVANCPHCFNTMKNEYPEFGDISSGRDIKIVHHSHFLKELLKKGSISLVKKLEEEITFHDPCYLGRYNDTYEEPREVLVQLGQGGLKEMKDSKEKGMCCGAGGGHFWMDMKAGERVNVLRANQAAETGANTVATGCPFCMQMLEDGIKLTNREENLAVRDIAELVADAMSPEE